MRDAIRVCCEVDNVSLDSADRQPVRDLHWRVFFFFIYRRNTRCRSNNDARSVRTAKVELKVVVSSAS